MLIGSAWSNFYALEEYAAVKSEMWCTRSFSELTPGPSPLMMWAMDHSSS